MRASKLMMTILVLAVAVGASGQTLQRSNARMAPMATIQVARRPSDDHPRCPGRLVHRGRLAVRRLRGDGLCGGDGPAVADGRLPAYRPRQAVRDPRFRRPRASTCRCASWATPTKSTQRSSTPCPTTARRSSRPHGRHQPAHRRVLPWQLGCRCPSSIGC